MASPIHWMTDILTTLRLRGHGWIGGTITVHEHALQCAALAHNAGERNELIAACLLHRYGYLLRVMPPHRTVSIADADLDLAGAHRLAAIFGVEVVEPIRLQTDALRYLCWQNPAYLDRHLSGQARALEAVGGAMTYEEALEFEVHPHSPAAIQVRQYNDLARVANLVLPRLESFRPLLLAIAHSSASSIPTWEKRRPSAKAPVLMQDLAWNMEP